MKKNLFIPLIVFLAFILLLTGCSSSITTIYLVRHADRDGSKDALTEKGDVRAQQLAHVLGGEYHAKTISAIFTTNTVRTWNTIKPLSLKIEVDTNHYSDPQGLAALVLKDFRGKRVVVSGHSNTCSKIIEAFGGEAPVKDIPHDEYDNLYIITVPKNGNVELLNLKFGAIAH